MISNMITKNIIAAGILITLAPSLLFGQRLMVQNSSGLPSHSLFGTTASADGNFAAVSAPQESYGEYHTCGAVYIYQIRNGEWKYFQKITPSDPSNMKLFGLTVKLVNYTLLAGAPGDNAKSGSVYLFTYNGSLWVESQKITPQNLIPFLSFGVSLDMIDGLAVVGSETSARSDSATGNVYFFSTGNNGLVEEAVIQSPASEENDLFASAIAIASGEHVLVSAPRGSGTTKTSGCVYVFKKTSDGWKLAQKLVSPNGSQEGFFGSSISYSDNRLLVGAFQEEYNGTNSGAAYIYTLGDDAKWYLEQRFYPHQIAEQDYFGVSVFLSRGIAFIGSPKWDNESSKHNQDMGCVDVFSYSDSGWGYLGQIKPEGGEYDDHFGMSITCYQNSLIIGSPLDDYAHFNDGSAYSYKLDVLFPELAQQFLPDAFELYHNYPNPFNSLTTIRYDLPVTAQVNITIYDILGNKIIELVNGEEEPGRKQTYWAGNNQNRIPSASGIYICRIVAGNYQNSRKMVLLR